MTIFENNGTVDSTDNTPGSTDGRQKYPFFLKKRVLELSF